MTSSQSDAAAARPSLLANIRAMPRAMWVLLVGTFLNRFGTVVMPFLTLYLTRQGYSEVEAGLALSAFGVGNLAASLIGGHLADHLGRRNTIVLSMFSAAGVMLMLSQAEGLPALVVLTLLAGLCTELYRPAASAMVIDLCTPEQQITASALYRLAVHLGFAAGPVTAGLMANYSFSLLFVADGGTSLLFGVLALVALPLGTRHAAPPGEQGHWLTTALADGRFLRFLIASLLINIVVMQIDSTLALHITKAGHSTATYGMLASINGALVVVFEVAMTVVTQRMPPRWAMALGHLLTGLGFALTAVAFSKVAIAVTIVIWTVGEMINLPVAGVYVGQLAPVHLRGRYMGLWTATWSVGLILGPTVGTMLFAYNETLLWTGCGILGVIAALLVLI